MIDYSDMDYHPVVKDLSTVLCEKTQSTDPLFFQLLVTYYLTKIASMMRCDIVTKDRGKIPVSMYAINLSVSGTGKGFSTAIIEEQIINNFRHAFLATTFPNKAIEHLEQLADARSDETDDNAELMLATLENEFAEAGELAFSFDSATTAAIKQMRHKLLLANAGSMNMEIDEIFSNLLSNVEVLTTFLELYDIGTLKPKLLKNTAENRRNKEIEGRTPTNMMLYGTPARLINDPRIEDELITMLDTGFARRCFFCFNKNTSKISDKTAEELYDSLSSEHTDRYLKGLSDRLELLADSKHFGKQLIVSRTVGIAATQYRLDCEKRASELSDHEEIKRAELVHRFFKTLKIAGTYAFVDGNTEVTMDNLTQAIKLSEASGEAFNKLLTRDSLHVRLAKYIASVKGEITHAEIVDDLPFYKGKSRRNELLELAIAWGYRNNVLIKKVVVDDIEFLSGESLKETELTSLIFSYSQHITEKYKNTLISWDSVHTLTQTQGYHFVNQHLLPVKSGSKSGNGYRDSSHIIPEFNTIIVDVDGTIDIATVKVLLEDYTYLLYETKRSTPEAERFRIIFPINYHVKLNTLDFSEFMVNVFAWLPFEVDTNTKDIARKWLSCNKSYFYNDGEIMDALLFIPKTKKAEQQRTFISSKESLDKMERWFIRNTEEGNRSNQLFKYAMVLLDAGINYEDICKKVKGLNTSLTNSLPITELETTVFKTVADRQNNRENI